MDRFVGISDTSSAAIHALALASSKGGRMTAAVCASELSLSPSYLAKVLQVLSRGGLLSSSRGAAGGFELCRDASRITCMEVMSLVDGPPPERDCLFREAVCSKGDCALKVMCDRVSLSVSETLKSTTIADVAASFERQEEEA